MNQHYLYRHIREDKNEPFYIGIGTKCGKYSCFETEYRRAFDFNKRSKEWKEIFNNTTIGVEILFESNNYNFIKEKEKEFIKLYGRKDLKMGCLVNSTAGGEGVLDYKHTEQSRKIMSDYRKSNYIPTEKQLKALQNRRNISKGIPKSDSHRKNLSLAKLGKPLNENQKLALDKAHKARIGTKNNDKQKEAIVLSNRINKVKKVELKDIITNNFFKFNSVKGCLNFLNLKSYSTLDYYKDKLIKKRYLIIHG